RSRPSRALHSFPTRRASDLRDPILDRPREAGAKLVHTHAFEARCPGIAPELRSLSCGDEGPIDFPNRNLAPPSVGRGIVRPSKRSEEHTSELQSPDHLLCRL